MALKLLIIKDLLSARSGGVKLTLDIARSLQESGHKVKVIFFHSDKTEDMIRREIADIDYEVYENKKLYFLSQIFQLPVINLLLKDAFKPDDSVNLLSQLSFARMMNKSKEEYDLMISMSLWTGLVPIFINPYYRQHSVLYFHEPPTFSGLPFPINSILRLYLRKLVKCVTLNISITGMMKKAIENSLGIQSAVLTDSFTVKTVSKQKESYVLADTRWTFVRDPFFLISIAKQVEEAKFIMCGGFGSSSLRESFKARLAEEGLASRVVIREQNTEPELDELYSKATCYVRWSSKVIDETGPSYGLIQAVSNGCVPIVSNNLGSAEYVSENVGNDFVVRNDPSEYANVIRKLFSDRTFLTESFEKVIRWRNSYTGKEYASTLLSLAGFDS